MGCDGASFRGGAMNNSMRVRTIVVLLAFLPLMLCAGEPKRLLQVDGIFASPTFRLRSIEQPQWSADGRELFFFETDPSSEHMTLYRYSLESGKKEMLLDPSGIPADKRGVKPQVASFQCSPDGRRILLSGSLPARRTKSGGNFGVYDIAAHSFRLLTDTSADQAIIKFSPDGKRIGFVRSNNLYVMDATTGAASQLTFDGSETILNGNFDWVYEEEFAVIDGWQWSPDGRRIAFWRLDQSPEPRFPLVWYDKDQPEATVEETRYPQAGESNARVRIGVVDLQTRNTSWVDLGSNPDIYVPRIAWTADPEVLAVERLNRLQDTLDLMLADARTGATHTILTETDTAWIDINNDLTFLRKSPQFLWTSNRDGYNHLYLYRLDGSVVRQVTRGPWEVEGIAGVDETRRRVAFTATEATPLERQLYSIGLDGAGMRRITREHGEHAVTMSPDGSWFLDTYSTAVAPPGMFVRDGEGKTVSALAVNGTDSLSQFDLGEHKFFSFTTTDSVVLNGWMITPPGFDPDKKYPVVMYVYGGPGSQTVKDEWGGTEYLWHQLLAERGYIVASVDNRGTGGRGKAFMQQTHRRLGLREVGDQIEAARYLARLPYVEPSRIGIWGWSGGGFVTCLAMTLGADYFKTGIAVAPVTSWRFYDTIYTERYMDTPQHNPEGYRLTSPITYAGRLKGNLLIVHGTTDDNVHWQNTIVFVNELIHDNKQVRTMFYPGREHGIRGDNATRHLFTLMTEYVIGNL